MMTRSCQYCSIPVEGALDDPYILFCCHSHMVKWLDHNKGEPMGKCNVSGPYWQAVQKWQWKMNHEEVR